MIELYLNGIKMDLKPGEVVATTLQANDLAKPDSVQSSYTNTFQVVATAQVRKALGFADDVASLTDLPYTVLDAQLLADGREILPFGLGEIVGFENNHFEVAVYSGNVAFFDELADKSIRDLDLSEYDHAYTFENVVLNANRSEGFLYDLVDRGRYLNLDLVNWSDLYPTTYAKAILDRIFKESGFTYSGLNSELVNRLLIPAVRRPQYSSEFLEARTTNAGTTAGERNKIEAFIETADFNTVSEFSAFDGSALRYDPVTKTYTADAPMVVNAEARLMARIGCTGGVVRLIVAILKNGNLVGNEANARHAGSLISPRQKRGTTYSPHVENLYLGPGDTLRVEIKFIHETNTVVNPLIAPRCEISYATNYSADGIDNRGADFFKITPLKIFPTGATMRLVDVLPDISQKDFIKTLLQLHNGIQQTTPYGNRVRFTEFREVETNTPRARDWSAKFVKESGLKYKFGDFGQNNHLRYKDDETVSKNYGNGVILCTNKNLPRDQDFVVLPFAASEPSVSIPGLVSVPVWKNEAEQKIEPRLLLQSRQVITYRLGHAVGNGFLEMGKTYQVQGYSVVRYRGFEFYDGQNFVANSGDQHFEAEGVGYLFDLDYATPITSRISFFERSGEPVSLHFQRFLIPTYYGAVAGILNQTKFLRAQMRITAADAESYDPTEPIWIERYQNYFYVNRISEYQAGNITEVELIRL